MDIQLALLASVLKGGKDSLNVLRDSGIEIQHLTSDAKKVYKFIEDFSVQYKDKLPSLEIVKEKLDIELPDVIEPVDFFIDEFKASKLHNFLNDFLEKCINKQSDRRPYETLEMLEDLLIKVKEQELAPSAIEELYSVGPDALALYDKFVNKEYGILTPWEGINEISNGFWPQDLIIFAARAGIGKTQLMVILAWHVVEIQKKKALFISPEMTRERLSLRFNSFKYKLPYTAVLNGGLDTAQKKRFFEGVEATKNNKGFGVISSKFFDYKVSSLGAAIAKYKPDVVFIDGVYLLQANGASRSDQAANLMNDIKKLAIKFNIPIIISTQFNKEVDTKKEGTITDKGIALTDVANWHNSMSIALFQDEDMQMQKVMELKVLKAREGVAKPVRIWWDRDTMNFEEIKKDKDVKKAVYEDSSTNDDPFAIPKTKVIEPTEIEDSPF